MDGSEVTNVAVIGGTGMDEIADVVQGDVHIVETDYGRVSLVACLCGKLSYWFLPRHGLKHDTPPHLINYRAQIAGLKAIGAERVLGVCSVGSLVPDILPGSLVVLTDFIDLTRSRVHTFCSPGSAVWHTDFTPPYCPQVTQILFDSCRQAGKRCVPVVYAGVDGPRYETPAEVRLYASWGAHVVGMTNVPEAILAREAGLCYGALGVVTNLAAGLGAHKQSHQEVRAAFSSCAEDVLQVVENALGPLSSYAGCCCRGPSCLS